ncbi:MAG TPA: type II secretion system F family protein, partial [Fimbriimonadaceae bacterium]|nr:type II secretion system F family protein [Fimbriimonadaceae bacterium]
MQLFKYKGYDLNGQKVEGEISAASIDEVERRVASQSVTVISIIPAGMRKGGGSSSSEGPEKSLSAKKKIADSDVATILRDLAVMAETGVPFVEALEAVISSARTPAIESGLKILKQEIVGGKGLSAAMRAANGVFPVLVCEMVKVAEEGGRLDRALASAATYVERSADLRKKIMNAMLYPIVLSFIAVATVTVLIVFVLPRFQSIFEKMGAQLPMTTKMMLAFGETIRSQPFMILFGIAGAVIGFKMLMRSPAVNKRVHLLLLKLPVLGELLRRLALSRAFQSIATLMSGNVALMAALEHGARVAGNPIIHDALMKARTGVEHGAALSDSMAETHVFPPMLVQMVSVGERTGRLAHLMSNTAAHMEEDVDNRLKAL